MMQSLEAMGRTAPTELPATKTAAPQNTQESFLEHFAKSAASSAGAAPPASDARRDFDAVRQVSGAAGQSAAGGTAADALGLIAAVGAKATIDGQTFYGTSAGWSLTPPDPATGELPSSTPAPSKGEAMLGFAPDWFGQVTSPTVNENAQPSGAVQLNRKLYATEETAQKLAEAVGATAVACESISTTNEPLEVQWELDFGDGKRLNAGLVADMFLRDPDRAWARLRAEIA
jgi:hypothetical protein